MRVSILIPCYNAKRWVGAAIESALAQTWIEKEVVVVDDGSTDGSLDEIRRFEGRIRWETGPNRGGNAARNRLLQLANGEWLQYLDADDYLLPNKISNQVEVLTSHPAADVVFGPVTMEYYEENGTRREVSAVPEPHDMWVLLARWYLRQTGSVLLRRQAVLEVGCWKSDQPCCQEHELYLRLLMARKRFVYCPDEGAIYRQRLQGSVSTQNLTEVHRRRLEIEQRAEDFLRATNELTSDRRQAINEARFEIARLAWLYDSRFAAEVFDTIRRSHQAFIPRSNGTRGPYRAVYRAFGFEVAEKVAQWKRTVFTK